MMLTQDYIYKTDYTMIYDILMDFETIYDNLMNQLTLTTTKYAQNASSDDLG